MDNLSQNIVKTACSKFFQFGIRSISVDDICADLRISKKTFYRIFPGKEDLIKAVLNYQTEILQEHFDKLQHNKNAIDALVLIIKEVKNHPKESISAFYYDLEKYHPDIFVQYKERRTKFIRETFEANLRQGIAEGYYREDLDIEMGAIFHAVQLSSMKATLEMCPKMSYKRLTEFYIDVLVRLITNEKRLAICSRADKIKKLLTQHYKRTIIL